jgi:hypothetical protein
VYIDNGGSSDEVTWASIGESMAQFASMATDGGFEVNQAGGDALLKAIHKMQDWVNSASSDLQLLAQEMPLGGSHAAAIMKPYVRDVAVDQQGFLTQLSQFRESLVKAEQGISTAMGNYHATEEANQNALRNVTPQ